MKISKNFHKKIIKSREKYLKMADKKSSYKAESSKVLEGLEGVRKHFDVIELSKKIKRQGDMLVLSQELKIKPRILCSAVNEGRILNILPNISKSKASILAALKTNREVKIFCRKHNLNNISARKLIKVVRKWNQDIQENPLLLVTLEEHDMIIGSLLGDSSIRKREKNSCFRFSHSIKQREYCNHKKGIINNFNISEFREVKRKIGDNFIHAVDFATKTHAIFNYYRDLFYSKGIKIIAPRLLNLINPRSLAYWICDDGSYHTNQGYIILCTNSYSLKEHQLIKSFFNKKFGLNPTIGFRDKKYHYLRFKQDDSKKLIKIIKPFMPNCMLYKIGENK